MRRDIYNLYRFNTFIFIGISHKITIKLKKSTMCINYDGGALFWYNYLQRIQFRSNVSK